MIQRSRKIKKISYHRHIKKIVIFLLVALYVTWTADQKFSSPLPEEGDAPVFFANQCDDEFSPLFRQAINEANSSILLIVYNLSDKEIIHCLNKKASQGVKIEVILDEGSHPRLQGIRPLYRQLSGLMHRKILVTDKKNVFIGSANFTPESLHIDDNFVAAFKSENLSRAIMEMRSTHLWMGGQRVDFYPLPEEREAAFLHLVHLLKMAKTSIKVAMFTLTHPVLIENLIQAHRKGIDVEVIVDRKSAEGTSRLGVEALASNGIPVKLSLGGGLFHHKMTIIDEKKIAFGSANWTKAAFTKNEECLLVIEEMNQEQIEKLKKLWHAIKCTSETVKQCSLSVSPLSILDKNQEKFILETTLLIA